MNKRILYILSVLCFLLLVSCTSEEELAPAEEQGEIWLSVVDTSKIEIVTRALSGFDVKDFNVSLSRGETVVFSSRKYGDIAGAPITCSAGSGYLLTAESCTESEAERTNSGWGQARLAGKTSFTVKPVEPTEVTLKCALANSSVNVEFSDFIKKTLSDYAITLYAADASSRSFTFNKNNYSYKTAYFNVGAVGRALQYTVSLTLPGEKEPHTYSNVLTLEPSHSYHLTVKLDDESKSKISIGIMVDGTLVEEKTFTEIINPYE